MRGYSLRSKLMALAGVEEVKIEENRTRETCNGLEPHSVRVIVTGGDDQDIAKVLADQPLGIYFTGDIHIEIEYFGTRMIRFCRGESK